MDNIYVELFTIQKPEGEVDWQAVIAIQEFRRLINSKAPTASPMRSKTAIMIVRKLICLDLAERVIPLFRVSPVMDQ